MHPRRKLTIVQRNDRLALLGIEVIGGNTRRTNGRKGVRIRIHLRSEPTGPTTSGVCRVQGFATGLNCKSCTDTTRRIAGASVLRESYRVHYN
jgi:hypothetical protein